MPLLFVYAPYTNNDKELPINKSTPHKGQHVHPIAPPHTLRTEMAGITLLYFALGFVSILFGLLALLCMSIPFILLAIYKKKLWCSTYCPRASLFVHVGSTKKKGPLPRQFTSGSLKKAMLWYFGLNLLFITGSTIQVALGNMASMEYIRLFIVIPVAALPQLITVQGPPFLLHLSYRFYSMMLSTTLLGLVLSRLYRPRTWCAICPVGSVSTSLLRRMRSGS